MNKGVCVAVLAAVAAGLAGCSSPSSSGGDIGLVDVPRIVANWPKFQNYQNQLNADVAAIQQARISDRDKQRQLDELNRRFQTGQTELTDDVRNAAQQVATDRHLRFVFTRQYIGYGGVDITSDVEKILKIDEKATPKP